MTMTRQEALERLLAVESELAGLQAEFSDQSELFDIYRQPLVYERDLLKDQLRTELATEDPRADMWISLRGQAFGFGSGSMEAVAHFLTNLRIAAKHTVSALKGVAHTGGRFLKEVEAATDYQFVALAPGSLRIGLARSAATVDASLPEGDFFEAQLLTDAIADASDRGELGIRAIRVLMRALEAAESEHALEDLRSELDDHGTLRVLYHARSLFPRGVETVEFSGRAIGASARFSTDAKDKLRRIGERLVQAERYVGGVGIVRMLDLDRRTLRLEFARIESLPELDTVNAEYGDDIDSPVSGTMGKPVRFSGSLRFDTKGVPQRLRIDSLNIVEASASADDLNVFVTA